MSNPDKTKAFRPHVKNPAIWYGTNTGDADDTVDGYNFHDAVKGIDDVFSREPESSDDFDFAEAMSPEYTPRPRAGVRHPSKASLKDRLSEDDQHAADRENGRAW